MKKSIVIEGDVAILHGDFITRVTANKNEVVMEVFDEDFNEVAESTIVLPGPLLLEKKE